MATLTMDIRATCDVVVPEHLAERLVPAIAGAAAEMESERVQVERDAPAELDLHLCPGCGEPLDVGYQHVDAVGVARCLACARGLRTIDDAGVAVGGVCDE